MASAPRSLATQLATFGCRVDAATGALTPPLHLSTTFQRDADLGFSRGHVYSRWSNPTRSLLEEGLAEVEGGSHGFAFASGQAALSALLQSLPGGLVIYPVDTYHGVRAAITGLFAAWGLRSVEVDMRDAAALEAALVAARGSGFGSAASPRAGPLLLHLETPSNPSLLVTDIVACAELGHEYGAVVCVDATWMTPVLCRPIRFGADVVMHSTTKYLGGHADVLGGALVISDTRPESAALVDAVRTAQRITGGVASPFDCWLVMRGVRSLLPRVRAHSNSAMRIAEYLATHPRVVQVFYPGLPTHPGHAVAARQYDDCGLFGGMLSVRIAGGKEGAVAFTNALRLFQRATSLGGTESLVEHRRSVEGSGSTTPDDLIRVSVGLEDADELIADLAAALSALALAAA